MTIFVVACGASVGVGVLGLLRAFTARSSPAPRISRTGVPPWWPRAAAGALVGIPVELFTKWPSAAVAAACFGFGLPALLRATGRADAAARTEALAVWTELLRDTLAAASGLSQAIVATAPLAPPQIAKEVGVLAARLSNGVPGPDALRMFADEVADPDADLVVCSLILAATARAQNLVDLLGSLAAAMREEVAMRLRVESGRASARSGVRTIVLFSVGFAALLLLVARSYLEPFGTSTGEMVLLVAAAFDAAGVLVMLRLVRNPKPERILGGRHSLGVRT